MSTTDSGAGRLVPLPGSPTQPCGPRDRVKERLEVYREAGVGTLIVSPMSFDVEQRKRIIRELAEML